MASLTLEVASVTAAVEASDAAASPILLDYAESLGLGGNAQAMADGVVAALVDHMIREGAKHKQRKAAAAARYAPENQRGTWA